MARHAISTKNRRAGTAPRIIPVIKMTVYGQPSQFFGELLRSMRRMSDNEYQDGIGGMVICSVYRTMFAAQRRLMSPSLLV